MKPLSSETRLRSLYNKYLYLDDKAYHDKIRFYEYNEQDVYNMRLQDSLWIQAGYLDAVFQVGQFHKFIDKSQELLQRLIFENISYFNGENLYEETLHRLSIAYYQRKNYEKSIHVSQQLLNINPARKDSRKVLFSAYRSSCKNSLKFIKAAFIVLALSAAFVLLVEQIVVASFFPEILDFFFNITLAIFIPAFSFLILMKLVIDARSFFKMKNWCQKAQIKQNFKGK